MTFSSQTAPSLNHPGRRDDSTMFSRTRTTVGGDGQWSAIVAGAIAGIAAGVLMTALGAALGLTATAAVADAATNRSMSADGMGQAAAGFGIGAGFWLLLTAAVVGLVGGTVLVKMSNLARAYSPGAHGFLTWSLGIAVAAMFAISGSGAISAALGVGAAGAAGAAANSPGSFRTSSAATAERTTPTGSNDSRSDGTLGTSPSPDRDTAATDAALGRSTPAMSPAERGAAIQAAEAAATAAASAAWFALISLLVGLSATIGAATRRKYQADSSAGLVQTA